ncbi:UNVERIFIED_CONTAM: DEAD-box ATP-dependent RNA helicase 5 [Sesamum calycinum]|uniref:RNA helicase n=1 Tax=Sesamum calycinum TaxID=2727403 RepID=A0AAW2QW46_9LAMI
MGGQKIHNTETEALNSMENGESKRQKKHKDKQKRKLEEADVEFAGESKKDVKKKNKKQEQEEEEEIANGSAEIHTKKKKKQKNEEVLNDGSVEIPKEKNKKDKAVGKDETLSNGSVEESRKKKKKDREGEEKEEEKNATDEVREATGVVVSGKNVNDLKYKALNSFEESGLPGEVLECCKTFDKPSPIQSHSWPFLLDGRDFIGIAATGSGKTIAFGVPAIMHVLSKRKIFDVLCDAGKPSGVQSVCIYGGTSKGPQISSLKSGVDYMNYAWRVYNLANIAISWSRFLMKLIECLTWDLNLRFRSILSQTSSVRQMVMFSATWPPPVHQLAQEFMDPHPVKVVVGSEDLAANHDVMQIVEVLDDRARDERLQTLLEKYHKSRNCYYLLGSQGWKVVSISGDKAQHARTQALSLFKEGTCPLMIATDVAARGLDIPDVEVVINYSFPLTTEDYVHRIGKQEELGLAGELINVLREAQQVVPESLLKFGTHVKKKESKLYGAHFREINANAPKATKITFDNSDNED